MPDIEYDDWDRQTIADADILIAYGRECMEHERILTAYRQCSKAGARLTETVKINPATFKQKRAMIIDALMSESDLEGFEHVENQRQGMAQGEEGSDKGTRDAGVINMEQRPV